MANIKSKSILKFRDRQFVDTLVNDLIKFGRVKVTGLGMFALKQMKPRKGFHIAKGGMVDYQGYVKVAFTPTLKFKQEVQKWKK